MSSDRFAAPSTTWPIVAYLAVVALSAAASVTVALNLWVVVGVAAVPWFLVVRARFGAVTAALLTLLGTLLLLLFAMMITAPLHLPVTASLVALAVVAAILGTFVVRARGVVPPTLGSPLLAQLAPALGGVVWIAVIVIAQFLPHTVGISWAMNGDSANNVLFARVVLNHQGVSIGGGENPVPLTSAVLAVAMAAGRERLPSSGLLAHDVLSELAVWTITIAALCFVVGMIVAASIPMTRVRVRIVAAAAGSLLPLCWYMVGYPIEFGFLNTHIALVVVLAAWLIYLRTPDRPGMAIGGLAVAATLALAVWSPLVLFPGALLLAVLVRSRRGLGRMPRVEAFFAMAGVAQLLGYALGVTLTSLLAQSVFLSAAGGAYPFSRWTLFALIVGTVVVGILARRTPTAAVGAVAVSAASALGFAALLFAARTTPDPWISYYPLKFFWLAGVLLFVIALGLVIGLATRWWTRRIGTVLSLAILTAACIVAVQAIPFSRTGYVRENPVLFVLRGDSWPNSRATVAKIFRYGDMAAPTILWRSGFAQESVVDFWVMQMQYDNAKDNIALSLAAYGEYDTAKIGDLCHVVTLMRVPVHVITADAGLPAEAAAACSSTPITISVARSGG